MLQKNADVLNGLSNVFYQLDQYRAINHLVPGRKERIQLYKTICIL